MFSDTFEFSIWAENLTYIRCLRMRVFSTNRTRVGGGVTGWCCLIVNCMGAWVHWESDNRDQRHTCLAYHHWASPLGHPVWKCGLEVVSANGKSEAIHRHTSFWFSSHIAIRKNRATNDDFGCWNLRVGWVHRVQSGAFRASHDPTKCSSIARGLWRRNGFARQPDGTRAVTYKVYL